MYGRRCLLENDGMSPADGAEPRAAVPLVPEHAEVLARRRRRAAAAGPAPHQFVHAAAAVRLDAEHLLPPVRARGLDRAGEHEPTAAGAGDVPLGGLHARRHGPEVDADVGGDAHGAVLLLQRREAHGEALAERVVGLVRDVERARPEAVDRGQGEPAAAPAGRREDVVVRIGAHLVAVGVEQRHRLCCRGGAARDGDG